MNQMDIKMELEYDWKDFQTWCRLCGSIESSADANREFGAEVFQLFPKLVQSDTRVCHECVSFLNALNQFIYKSKMVSNMFMELTALSTDTELTSELINNTRDHYELPIALVESVGVSDVFEDVPNDLILEEEDDENEETQEIHIDVENQPSSQSENDSYDEEYLEESELVDGGDESDNLNQYKKLEKTENEKLFEFTCHICYQEFPKMNLLSTHCRDEHQCLPQVACLCGKLLSTWKRLMTHRTRHLCNVEYECRACNLQYKTQIAYDKHIQARHGPNAQKHICPQCGRSFKDKQVLRNHEKIHLPDELKLKYPCNHCEKKFINSHCLKIHVARIHEKVCFYFCELCGKGCITKSDLKWHMDVHQQERLFECDICQLKFKSTNSLRIHKKRHFNVEKNVSCTICSKEFRNKTALNNHKLVHSNVKKYKCNLCGAEYKRLETYKCHVSTHTGARPFSCLWCERTFVNSANCRKHKLKSHPQEVEEYELLHGKRGVPMSMPQFKLESSSN